VGAILEWLQVDGLAVGVRPEAAQIYPRTGVSLRPGVREAEGSGREGGKKRHNNEELESVVESLHRESCGCTSLTSDAYTTTLLSCLKLGLQCNTLVS